MRLAALGAVTALFAALMPLAGSAATPDIHTDASAFVAATGATAIAWETDADTALPSKPFGEELSDYSCTTDPVTTPDGEVTVANPDEGILCYIGPDWDPVGSLVDPQPERPTLVWSGEDDFELTLHLAQPVHAVGFRLLTNQEASETVTLTYADDSNEAFSDGVLGTDPNGFHFVGFSSEKEIVAVTIDTTGGATQNEGIDGIWLSALPVSPTLACEEGELFVSSEGTGSDTPVVSTDPLEDGVEYRVEASGVYFAGGQTAFDIRADAEFSQSAAQRAADAPWTDEVDGYESEGEGLLELLVDGAAIEWSDGVFQPDHVYEYTLTGDGGPATFRINDIAADNNTGGLCVSITRIEQPEEPGDDTGGETPPDVVQVSWMPPVTHAKARNPKSTLPIKFRLDGTPDGDVYLQVHEGPFDEGIGADDIVATFELGTGSEALRMGDGMYIANFRLKDSDLEPGTYTAVVHAADGTVLGHIDFTVGAEKGHKGGNH